MLDILQLSNESYLRSMMMSQLEGLGWWTTDKPKYTKYICWPGDKVFIL